MALPLVPTPGEENSLFNPIDITLFAAPAARVSPNWSIIRASIYDLADMADEKIDTDEMKQTVSLVKAYLKQGEDYLACLTEVENSWGDEATQDQSKELIRNHNAMVDAMQASAESFNAELAKYQARQK